MKCSVCSKEAIIEVRWKGKAYCETHFRGYFLGQVRKVFDKFGVKGKICLALSGGKDSAACLEALTHLDVDVEALFIDLGIPGFSEECREAAEAIAAKLDVDLHVLNLQANYGTTIPSLVELEGKKPCSMCGTIRRYLMNKYAYEHGFDYLATGHNLSDQLAFVFNNLANVYLVPFREIGPVLRPREEGKLVGKVKPLYYLTDEECKVYSELAGLPICEDKCPYAETATTNLMKRWLHGLDLEMPGVLRRFAESFMRISEGMERDEEISGCRICGYATTAGVCKFCRLMRRVRRKSRG